MSRIILLVLCVTLFWNSNVKSQSQDASLMGAGGNMAKAGDIFLSYSFGEPINSFTTADNHWLTQGYQQPGKIMLTSTSHPDENINFRITPNPATHELILHFSSDDHCDNISIITLSGERIHIVSENNNEQILVNIGSLPSGTYWIEAVCDQQRTFIKSFIKL